MFSDEFSSASNSKFKQQHIGVKFETFQNMRKTFSLHPCETPSFNAQAPAGFASKKGHLGFRLVIVGETANSLNVDGGIEKKLYIYINIRSLP